MYCGAGRLDGRAVPGDSIPALEDSSEDESIGDRGALGESDTDYTSDSDEEGQWLKLAMQEERLPGASRSWQKRPRRYKGTLAGGRPQLDRHGGVGFPSSTDPDPLTDPGQVSLQSLGGEDGSPISLTREQIEDDSRVSVLVVLLPPLHRTPQTLPRETF